MSDNAMNNTSRSDLERLDAMTDGQIDTSDIPALGEDFFTNAKLRLPANLKEVKILIDPSVLAWFQSQGEDWPQRLNAALRLYAQAHQAYGEKPNAA